jgi:hypothetical protein
MKILDYNNTAINLAYLLYLKVEINKENPKKSYIVIVLNEVITNNNIIIQYEDLISDETFESMKNKVYKIEDFEPELFIKTIYHWIVFFVNNETEDRKTYMNIKSKVDDLISKSYEKQRQYLEDVKNGEFE